MNIGQVFETTIGYALMELRKRIRRQLYENVEREELEHSMFLAYGTEMLDTIKGWPDEELREQAKTVVEKGVKVQIAQFHNLTHEDLTDFLASMGLDTEGKVDLYDGMTGQKFLAKVLVGYEFILSLRHFARDKLHARSVGKYSLITQQPLQGKKLFGGQRFGEMEFWATQAYGACCTMQELGTVKSCSKPERLYAYRTFTRVGRYGILGRQIERGSFELFKKDLNSGGILLEIVYDEV
jgi:DNA-directed RNA polymerase subunit beta